MNKREIGEALDNLAVDVRRHVLSLTAQYRASALSSTLKQAVDTPHRARAQISAWIVEYNSRNGAGTAQTFLASCLAAVGSTKTLATIDASLTALESQAQTLVNHVTNDAWTWAQVASAIEAQIAPPTIESLSYDSLPIPAGYVTVWGDPW